MKHNQRIGKWGEDIATDYLAGHGCEIVTRNARTPYGEIDIVARQGDITIFVEAKTRTSNKMGLSEESITNRKQEHMLAAADHYAVETGSTTGRSMSLPLKESQEQHPGLHILRMQYESFQETALRLFEPRLA